MAKLKVSDLRKRLLQDLENKLRSGAIPMTTSPNSLFLSIPDAKTVYAGLATFRSALNRIKNKINPNWKQAISAGSTLNVHFKNIGTVL